MPKDTSITLKTTGGEQSQPKPRHKSTLHATYTVLRLLLLCRSIALCKTVAAKDKWDILHFRRNQNQMAFGLWAGAEPREGVSDFPPVALPADRAVQLIFKLSHQAGPAHWRSGWHFTCPAVLENLQSHNTNHCKTIKPLAVNLSSVFKKIT